MQVPPFDKFAAQWEELARTEPYFRLLATDGEGEINGSTVATDAFFQTGEDDVAALLAALKAVLPEVITLDSVLDYGCGVGRLTIPLARRAGQVVACDVSPTMMTHARATAARLSQHNITFVAHEELSVAGPFDFICSLLVFQYVPPSTGYGLIRTLLQRLNATGIAALQLPLRTTSRVSRLNALTRSRSRASTNASAHHTYDESLVIRAAEEAGGHVIARFPGGEPGSATVLVIRRDG